MKTRLLDISIVGLVIFIALAGCANKPKPQALAPALPACPAGYTAVSSHEATQGPTSGHGFVMVPYTANGKALHLFCTPDGSTVDPRINKPSSIPQPQVCTGNLCLAAEVKQ